MKPREFDLSGILHEAEVLSSGEGEEEEVFHLKLGASMILRLRFYLVIAEEVDASIVHVDPGAARWGMFEAMLHEESMRSLLLMKLNNAFPSARETLAQDAKEERPEVCDVMLTKREIDYLNEELINDIKHIGSTNDSGDGNLDKWCRELNLDGYTTTLAIFLDLNRALHSAGGTPPREFFTYVEIDSQ